MTNLSVMTIIDKLAYLPDEERLVAVVTKSNVPYSGDITIPSAIDVEGVEYRVTEIADEAFMGCKELHSVVLGDCVECIGISAFEGCSSLSRIEFGNAMHIIGMQAFKDCESLRELLLSWA